MLFHEEYHRDLLRGLLNAAAGLAVGHTALPETAWRARSCHRQASEGEQGEVWSLGKATKCLMF